MILNTLFLIVYSASSTFLAANSQEHFIPNCLQPPVLKSQHHRQHTNIPHFCIKRACEYKNMASFACSPVNFRVVLVWEGTNSATESGPERISQMGSQMSSPFSKYYEGEILYLHSRDCESVDTCQFTIQYKTSRKLVGSIV